MKYRIYTGTYTEEIHFASGKIVKGRGKGIYYLTLDTEKGKLEVSGVKDNIINPSYLTLSVDGKYLYAANERKMSEGVYGGTVSAFQIDGETGELTFLNKQFTNGTDPCYVAVHPACVYVCNYGSGSLASYPIHEDGSLGERRQFIQYEGKSVDKNRQAGPHAHSMVLFEENQFALMCNLGTDRIEAYRIREDGWLEPEERMSIVSALGAGPRHMEFSKDGRFLYVVNELNSSISVYTYDKAGKAFREQQTVPSVLDGYSGENTCADIHVAEDGRFVFASNRGNSTIVCYRRGKDGNLIPVGQYTSGGQVPRSFLLTPDGKFLVAANQNSDSVTLFALEENGGLRQLDEVLVYNPVCVKLDFMMN